MGKKSRKKKRPLTATSKNDKIVKAITETLIEDVKDSQQGVEAIFTKWEKTLIATENDSLLAEIMAYRRCAKMMMDLKDRVIEKLLYEFEAFTEHRARMDQRNIELVDDTLNLFKKEIDMICGREGCGSEEAPPPDRMAQIGPLAKNVEEEFNILKHTQDMLDFFDNRNNAIVEADYKQIELDKRKIFSDAIANIQRTTMMAVEGVRSMYSRIMSDYDDKAQPLLNELAKLRKKNKNMQSERIQLQSRIETLIVEAEEVKIEVAKIELSTELKAIIIERDELRMSLIDIIGETKNNSRLGEEHLKLLGRITKEMTDKMDYLLEKGAWTKRNIDLCVRLEASIRKNDLFPKADEIPEDEQISSETEEMPKFWDRVNLACLFMKRLEEKRAKLRKQNNNAPGNSEIEQCVCSLGK